MVASEDFQTRCSTWITELIGIFRQGTAQFCAMAEKLDVPWDPKLGDPRRLHNCYVRNLVAAYASKVADLSPALLRALEASDYLTYALCGRALIETAATLPYYLLHEYRPLLDKGSLTAQDLRKLVEIDDRHLRGSRFDWESFLFRRYSKLKEDAARQLKDKSAKKNTAASAESVPPQQRNVLTCVEKWATETPEVLIAYNLFCDLVHPNIGSNFLVASVSSGNLYFTKGRGDPIGHHIFEQSFPILVSVTQKPFGPFLVALMGTCWQEQELSG